MGVKQVPGKTEDAEKKALAKAIRVPFRSESPDPPAARGRSSPSRGARCSAPGFASPGFLGLWGAAFFGCGSELNRRGKPQVLDHVSTYQGFILEYRFFEPQPFVFA